MKCIVIHYNEIALKGKNRSEFENKLVDNIKEKLGKIFEKVYKIESRILIEYNEKNEEKIIEKLKKVIGISYFGIGKKTKREEKEVIKFIEENKDLLKNKTAKVETKRSDKNFKTNSMEFSRKIGEYLHEELKNKIKMKDPEAVVSVEILRDYFLVFIRKEKGIEGMPVGSSGRVLCLLSGGIDSIVASYLMMKRGCVVDFLHIAPYPAKKVKDSKIMKIVSGLKEYGNKGKLYLVPYTVFYKYTFEKNPKYEMILFRRFIYSLAQDFCREKRILGIVSGDSLGQVASQTLENLYAATAGIEIPIYRPLISFNKNETINIAKEIGMFEIANEKYRDCCSLSAVKHPATKAKKEIIDSFAEEVDLEKIKKEAKEKIEIL